MRFLIISCILLSLSNICNANDSKEQLEINANSVKYVKNKNIAVYSGNVVATQGKRKLTANTLEIHLDNNNKIIRAIAYGQAKFKSLSEKDNAIISGNAVKIEYDPEKKEAEFIEQATLRRNEDKIKGEHLIYNFQSGDLSSIQIANTRTTVTYEARP